MKPPKISVIVPIYNVENYLGRCLESILKQTLRDWECLLIDDGSTDRSGSICDEFMNSDNRFRVFHKQNEGVALTRKFGMNNASVEYIIHVDSDDYIENDMLERMYDEINKLNVDILVTDYYLESENGDPVIVEQPFYGHTCHEMVEEILYQKLHGGLWNKLMKASIYRTFLPEFYKDINHSEDVLMWAQLSRFSISVAYMNSAFYHYISRDGVGITINYTKETFYTRLRFIDKLKSYNIHPKAINSLLHMVKIEAFLHGCISRKEYYSLDSMPLATILSVDRFYYKFLGFLLYLRLFYTTFVLSKLLRSIKNS